MTLVVSMFRIRLHVHTLRVLAGYCLGATTVMGEVPRWLISLNMPTLMAGDQVNTKAPRSPFYLPALLELM